MTGGRPELKERSEWERGSRWKNYKPFLREQLTVQESRPEEAGIRKHGHWRLLQRPRKKVGEGGGPNRNQPKADTAPAAPWAAGARAALGGRCCRRQEIGRAHV